MNAASYPFVRDPHFKFRALDVSRSPEPLRDWIAATGANAVYLKRGRPDAKRLRECAELGIPDETTCGYADIGDWGVTMFRIMKTLGSRRRTSRRSTASGPAATPATRRSGSSPPSRTSTELTQAS